MSANDLARLTEQVAVSQNGVMEQPLGSNAGPEVDQYLAYVHAPSGLAWCSAFACWCVGQAASQLNIPHQLKFSAGSQKLWALNPDLQIPNITSEDLPCIGIFNHGNNLGHVVIFIGLDESTGQLQSIAGNTNDNGSRSGIGVFILNKYNLSDPELLGGLRIE